MHPAKRRKLEQTTATLNRPFRSPLRTNPNRQASTCQSKQDEVNPQNNNRSLDSDVDSPTSSPVKSELEQKIQPFPDRSTPTFPQQQNTIRTSPTRLNDHDPEHVALQKQHSALALELTRLRQSLDIARQALKIEKSNQDAELDVLITKWRNVARETAEELFTTAKDRVNKMGGVGAWRERTQRKPGGWQDEEPLDESELTEEQKEQYAIAQEEALAEAQKYGLVEAQPVAQHDDDSFTMDMMLKQMNIELDLVGYDKKLQRWVDEP